MYGPLAQLVRATDSSALAFQVQIVYIMLIRKYTIESKNKIYTYFKWLSSCI